MAILDKVHKIIPRIKTAAGYIQYAFRAKDVRMEDNTDLETKITEINNNLIHVSKYDGLYTFNKTDRTVLIPKNNFPEIKSENIIFYIGIYCTEPFRCNAIWENDKGIQLTILGGTNTGDKSIIISVFYI